MAPSPCSRAAIDIAYPPENEDLQRAIGEQGLLISERSPGFSPRGKDFPRRNRLISGVSLGVVVVEAAERSGSLITARLAGEQGREVFAVPGSPLDPRSAGTNNLLKQGACLVSSARDIIETLAPILGRPPAPPPVELAAADEHRMPEPLPDIRQSEREQIVSALGPSPVDIDELIRATGLATRRSISCCWSSIWPAGSSVTVSSLSRSSDRGLPCDDGSFSRDSPSGSWPLPGRHR
jgi:DNA processing protein